MPTFVIEPLSAQHKRHDFSCGVEPLDRYFHQQATQDMRRLVAKCLVAVDENTNRIAGYYTLSASGIPINDLPPDLRKRLPRYDLVPVALLGRLAIDLAYQQQKLGAALLYDALERASTSDLAVFALIVNAQDEKAKAFYQYFGFITFQSQPLHLFLPLKFKISK
jgi:predicted GNAT family N-acyltransferase